MDKNEDIKEAVEELTIMSKDEELRRLADLREKAIRDERSALAYAKEEGVKQGIELGLKEKEIQIAKNMLEEKIDIEVIKRVTGLTEDEIQKLQ